MLCKCEHCSEEFSIPTKKWAQRRGKTYKIFYCPNCSRKNFVPILMKYQKSEFDERNQLV